VVANAAAALLTASHVDSLKAGVAAAQQAIDSRAAADKLEELVRWTSKRGA
jgi:anthranilate phosphoribosyltransferase